jgi:hypothetical protein
METYRIDTKAGTFQASFDHKPSFDDWKTAISERRAVRVPSAAEASAAAMGGGGMHRTAIPEVDESLVRQETAGSISTMGTMAGGMLGGVPGEVAGSVGAHKLNQAIGVESGSPTEFGMSDVISGGLPLIARLPQAVVAGVRGVLGSTRAGQTILAEQGVAQGRQLPKQVLRPPTPEIQAQQWAAVERAGGKVPTRAIRNQGVYVIDAEEQLAKAGGGLEDSVLITEMKKLIGTSDEVEIGVFNQMRTRIAERMKQLGRSSEPGAASAHKAYAQLYGSFDEALDDAVSSSMATPAQRQALMQAREGYKLMRASEEAEGLIEKAITTNNRTGTEGIKIGTALDTLRKGAGAETENLRKTLQATGQREAFEDGLKEIHRLTGGTLAIDPRVSAILSGGVGATVGGLAGGTVGGTVGALGVPAVAYIMGKLLMSDGGRAMVAQTLKVTNGVLTPQVWAAWVGAVAGARPAVSGGAEAVTRSALPGFFPRR